MFWENVSFEKIVIYLETIPSSCWRIRKLATAAYTVKRIPNHYAYTDGDGDETQIAVETIFTFRYPQKDDHDGNIGGRDMCHVPDQHICASSVFPSCVPS